MVRGRGLMGQALNWYCAADYRDRYLCAWSHNFKPLELAIMVAAIFFLLRIDFPSLCVPSLCNHIGGA